MARTSVKRAAGPPSPRPPPVAGTGPLDYFLDQALARGPLAARLQKFAVAKATSALHLIGASHPAQVFCAALLARALESSAPESRLWVVCKQPREQEAFHQELSNWCPAALRLPDVEISVAHGAVPDPEFQAERLRATEALNTGGSLQPVVIHHGSWRQNVAAPSALGREILRLRRGDHVDRDDLIQRLVTRGYSTTSQVAERGQLALRGGILDIFSWQSSVPTRLEFFGDEIDSIRDFDVNEQTSLRPVDEITVLLGLPADTGALLKDYVRPEDALVYADDPDAERDKLPKAKRIELLDLDDLEIFPLDLREKVPGGRDERERDLIPSRVKQKIKEWNAGDYHVSVCFSHEPEVARIRSVMADADAARLETKFFAGTLAAGFEYRAAKLAVITSHEVFGQALSARAAPSALDRSPGGSVINRTQIDFSELVEGELVVHINHGLARFRGIQKSATVEYGDGRDTPNLEREDTLILEFAESARLFVPLSQSFLVSRYVALGKKGTGLSKLSDTRWSTAKKSAEKSVYDFAAKLLKMQAQRETQIGHAFAPDAQWQIDFESAFPYTETPDQLQAIREVKADMESPRPMDRLICGDVGFGKTEIAIRAAFKAVMGGKQAAMLVPTTVLAQQHFENFARRMDRFPVSLGLLSRFRTAAEQNRTLEGLRDGSVDLVIGTHRLISQDVVFKDLGLLIIDEEQRFGVRHKERIKNLYPLIDILTLSATPIPRTLYLSLVGTRDLSTLNTPPANRFPVETVVCPYDERIIRDAIRRELERQGQVYFLHNRVGSIEKVRDRIHHLCPGARVDLGHGQMDEGQLEEVMHRFVAAETDVLIATTIIESGLDIPNANTIIIDRADRFGLADLYQLRGRVGRGTHKAYAFLMLPRELMMAPESRKRLSAIRQYSALGAGFKIALRDLEIRGAGNILGEAQSGHITAIGFELYCQLLRQAVSHLKGERVQLRLEVALRLDFIASNEAEFHARTAAITAESQPATADPGLGGVLPAYLPANFIEDARLRMQAYRHLAEVTRYEQVKDLKAAWRDRFGQVPQAAEHLLTLAELKIGAAAKRLAAVETQEGKLMLTRRGDYILLDGRFPRLTSKNPESRLREIFSVVRSLPG